MGIVCLTLAKWETVSGQFGGYRSWSFRANSTHNRFGRLRSALTAIRSPRLGRTIREPVASSARSCHAPPRSSCCDGRGFLRAEETRRRDLSWRPVGGAILGPSGQVSSVRQEDDSSHQADGAYHLEADPSLSRRLLSDLSDHRRGRGSVGAGATRRLHHRAATSAPRFGGAAWRGIHGTRRRALICTVAGRRNRFAAEFATMIG